MAMKPGPELIVALGRKAKGPPPGPAPDSPPATSGSAEDLKPAIAEFMKALEAGDVEGATEAFKSACDICASYGG